MSFGTDLQGKKSHEAFLRFQDAEIRFLDNVKRCLNVRIDTDKKYSASLNVFVQQAQKVDLSEHQQYSSSYRAWDAIIQQTSKYVEILKKNTEELGCKTMEKINNLINDKKAARKQYLDDRNKLEQEFTKVQDEVQKQKQEYSKAVERLKGDKAKYNDLQLKVTSKPAKVEDAKTRFTKSTGKLHKIHNEYVLSLREVVSHQNCYLKRTLPTILDYHQTKFELLGDQCKDILQDYQRLTDYSTEDFCDIFRQIGESVSKINPEGDTSDFISEVRTDPLPTSTLEYDNRLLDDCETSLTENEIAVDNETVETLNSRLSAVEVELSKVTKSLEEKESSLTEMSTTVKNLQKYTDEETKALNLEFISKRKDLENLRREITEFTAKRDTLQVLCDTIKTPLQTAGDNVPSALVNNDSTADISVNSTTSAASGGGSVGGLKGLKSKFTGVRKKINHEKEDPQRAPSYEEATVDSTSNGPRIPSTSEGNGIPDASALPLEEEEWFHGVLPREEVQRLLSNDGDYLVRESKNRKTNETQYVLSVYWQGHRHFIIQYGEGGWRFEGSSFPTVSELVQNQHKSGTAVTTKSQAILRNPILREQWQLRNDDIALEMKIGNGNFGEVYRGVYKPRSMTVAVKTCKDTLSEDQRKKFLQEGRILKQYDHPNIVRFIGIAAQRQPVMIVMEYVSGGALLNYLRKHGKAQSKKTLTKMCEDAANGMAYLESKNCIHRDLAARNCLIGENNVVKISDFGMSREEEEYTVSDGLKQIPIKWTAPEALLYGKYTSLCDVWSFGILMWEVFSGGLTPYQGMSNAESREKVDSGYRMPASQGTPEEVYTLMCSCWERNPSKRPHFSDIYSKLKSIGLQL